MRRPADKIAGSTAPGLPCRASTMRRVTTLDKFAAKIGAMAATDRANAQDANSAPCQALDAIPVTPSWYADATAPLKTFAPALNANRFSMLGPGATSSKPRHGRIRSVPAFYFSIPNGLIRY